MINKVMLIGRLGKDPEVRHFENNSSVCNFSLATGEVYTDKEGNRIEQTEWHNIAIWRKGLVDIAEKYLKKGHLVYLEGKLRTRNWDDPNGNKRYTTEVVVDNFRMLEQKGNTGEDKNDGKDGFEPKPKPPTPATDVSNVSKDTSEITDTNSTDDLPF